MNILFVVACTVSVVFVALSCFLFTYAERLRRQNTQFIEQKSVAVTERTEMERRLESVIRERDGAHRLKDEALAAKQEAQKQYELLQQRMQEAEKRMADWETQRAESVKAARASILEAGGQLSSKLLEDHKREAEAAKKDAEAIVKKTSDALFEQVMNVTKSVAALQGQSSENRDKMATVWKALTTPGGAGSLAEVGLENSLKNLGLEPGRDYVMQYSMSSEEAGSLRPDAVIFLPQDMVMVIDSKASKFLIEVVAQESGSEAEALTSLKKTMNDHLKALVSRNYSAAIQAAYKESGRAAGLRSVLNVMYLPTDNAVLHIRRADPEFVQKAERVDIILAGPASLSGLLSLARLNIGMARQAANQDTIVEYVQELMENLITVLGHAEKVGRGLKSAADNFDQFARSVNRRLLPKARQLGSLGVKPAKNKELPGRIVSYEVRLSDDLLTIEGEAEAVEETGVVEAFPKKASA